MISFPLTNRPKTTFVSGLVALALLSGALPAAATDVSQANARPQVTVRYSALDLSGTEGAATLYRNLQRASSIVCGRYERDLTLWNMRHQCYEKTLRDAVQRVDHPILAALHEARTLGSSIG